MADFAERAPRLVTCGYTLAAVDISTTLGRGGSPCWIC